MRTPTPTATARRTTICWWRSGPGGRPPGGGRLPRDSERELSNGSSSRKAKDSPSFRPREYDPCLGRCTRTTQIGRREAPRGEVEPVMEGRLVLERFRLAEELGRGAFGTVHRAR